MLQHDSALNVGHIQGVRNFFACAAYTSTNMLGIIHMIRMVIMNI
jgi:hypothetical protein